MQLQLVQNEKMATVGQLAAGDAAGVAHEINEDISRPGDTADCRGETW
ncbi:MAG: hypothetical protein GDA56_24935 [Hormoscilla sp. GM7CHS1pb]|nr:hypothetical protein [Hormoscilla sp. GM7CHS1pb]